MAGKVPGTARAAALLDVALALLIRCAHGPLPAHGTWPRRAQSFPDATVAREPAVVGPEASRGAEGQPLRTCRAGSQGFREKLWQQLEPESPPRRVHTFLQLPDIKHADGSAPLAVLDLWRRAWAAEGFAPKVLTLADAKKHELYEQAEADLARMEKAGLLGRNAEYQRYCYLRYFAVSAAGGGWLTDYDTIPLRMRLAPDLPRKGRFTVFEGHVPSLVSGSAAEFARAGRELLREGVRRLETGKGKPWPDMLGLQALMKRGVFKAVEARVSGLEASVGSELLRSDACTATQERWALHVSPAMANAVKRHFSQRAALAMELREKWQGCCEARKRQLRKER